MGKSLQDQLLKAGLANKKQAVRARKAKNEKQKQQRQGKATEDETAQRAEAERQAKIERDRELNRQKQAEVERKAIAAQIRQLIQMNAVPANGDIEYRYTDNNLIRTLMVSASEQKALARGALSIVRDGENASIVPKAVAEKIAERDADRVIATTKSSDASDDELDDEYADYKIPDDLMW